MSVVPVKVKPMGARVLSRLLPPEEKAGPIFLARVKRDDDEESYSSVRFSSKRAIVVAIGPGVENVKTGEITPIVGLKEGDEILLPMYPGVAVPQIGIETETGELVEILPSQISKLMMTDYSKIVCKTDDLADLQECEKALNRKLGEPMSEFEKRWIGLK